MDQVASLLESEPAARAQADEALLWRAYNDALFFAARGARAEARRATTLALRRAPNANEIVRLRDALTQTGEGPLDIAPFTTGAQ
jgi:hypothetical protein